MRCQPGITIPPIGSRGDIPTMAVMSDWNRFLEVESLALASASE
jgi:hypothetical protein